LLYLTNIWKNADSFGKISFFFRLLGYLFYSVFLLLFIREFNESLSIGHGLIILNGFLIPWFYLFDYVKNGNNNKILIKHLSIDFFLMGLYVGFIHLSYLPTILFILSSITNYVASKGYRGIIRFLLFPMGYVFYLIFYDFKILTELPINLNLWAIAYVFIHLNILAFISYRYSRNLHRTKNLVLKQQDEILAQSDELKVMNSTLVQSNTNLE